MDVRLRAAIIRFIYVDVNGSFDRTGDFRPGGIIIPGWGGCSGTPWPWTAFARGTDLHLAKNRETTSWESFSSGRPPIYLIPIRLSSRRSYLCLFPFGLIAFATALGEAQRAKGTNVSGKIFSQPATVRKLFAWLRLSKMDIAPVMFSLCSKLP